MTTAIRIIPARRVPGGRFLPFVFGYLHGRPWYEPRWAVWCCRTVPGKRTRYYRKLYSVREAIND